MRGEDVRRASAASCAFLGGSVGANWTQRSRTMDATVAEVVAHIASGLLWYAVDAAAGPAELSTVELTVPPASAPAELLRTLRTASVVLAATLDAAEPGRRGWHPAGLPDASGFAAMACDEVLVHTADAASGLGLEFRPPPQLAEATLRRLFPTAPAAPAAGDPWELLLWANGRADLPGLQRQRDWRWHCAPLSDRAPEGEVGHP